MKKFPRCSLLDLPIVPPHRDLAATTAVVQRAYLRERNALQHASELRPFIRRWRNLWLLRPGQAFYTAHPGSMLAQAAAPLLWSEKAMLEGHFDARKVLSYLLQQPNEGPLQMNPEERDWQICGHLCIPGPLLSAFQISKYFEMKHDLGLVRLYLDTYPEFIDRLREGDDLPYSRRAVDRPLSSYLEGRLEEEHEDGEEDGPFPQAV